MYRVSNGRMLRRIALVSVLLVAAFTCAWLAEVLPGGHPDEAPNAAPPSMPQYGGDPQVWSAFIAKLSKGEHARIERKANKTPKPYTNPDEAQRYFLEQRTGGAPLDYSLIQEAKEVIAGMPRASSDASGFILNGQLLEPGAKAAGDISAWTELGPGNIGGRTRALLMHPANNQILYAGGVAGGVWVSTNGAASWEALDDLMDNLAVTTLAFEGQGGAFVNTNVIYAGTGEGFFNGDAVRGAGIFKSSDAGATWTQLPATATSSFHYVNKIVASPNNSSVLYAATNTGVWKTINAGATWLHVLSGSNFQDIEIRTDIATDTLIASRRSNGVYRSLDAGATWSFALAPAAFGRADLAIAPSNQNTMYALVSNRSNNHRLLNVYRSTDGGATWAARIAGSFNESNLDWLLLTNPLFPTFHQGWYDNVIAVAPHDENIVFAGGIDMFRSDDGGSTWGQISYWFLNPTAIRYAHADQHIIVFDPGWDGVTNQTMIVGNDGGLQRTHNALAIRDLIGNQGSSGVIWNVVNNNYGVTQFYHGLPGPPGVDEYFGGTQDNGTVFGADVLGLNGWFEISGGDGGYVGYSPNNPDVIFAETQNLSIRRSIDHGFSFSSIVNNLIDSGFLFIVPFRMDPSNDNRIWIGGDRAWRSENATSAANPANVTWTQASTVIGGAASAFAIDPNDSDSVWMGISGKVYHTDVGTTATSATLWTNVTPPGFSGWVSSIEVDINDRTGNTVYFTNANFDPSGNKIYGTVDRGANWTDLTNNLPDMPAHTVVIQRGFPQNIFLGTELGVFVSQNFGKSWANMNSIGFVNTVVENLAFQNRFRLYAFTHGRGSFRAQVDSGDLVATGGTLISAGPVGGGFTPSCFTYLIGNLGTATLNWTAHISEPWLTVSPPLGTLNPRDIVEVTVCIGANASTLPHGTYQAKMAIEVAESNENVVRTAVLDVDGTASVASFTLNNNPGWSTGGQWAFGVPQGMGGDAFGNPDPTSGATGSNVFGVNLNGDYSTTPGGPFYLTTGAIDCTSIENAVLKFKRWLNTDFQSFVFATVEVSNDGTSWNTIWDNGFSDITDSSWTEQELDISAIADGQSTVFVRWGYQIGTEAFPYSGWNIDDIEIRGLPVPVAPSNVWVDFAWTGMETGSELTPFNTLQGAIDALTDDGSGTINIKGDTADNSTNETPLITKPMTIQAVNGTVQIGQP